MVNFQPYSDFQFAKFVSTYKFGQLLFQDSGKTIHSAEKNDTSDKRAGFFTEVKQKKIQNGRLKKFKMAANSQYFFIKFSWIGPWVTRID